MAWDIKQVEKKLLVILWMLYFQEHLFTGIALRQQDMQSDPRGRLIEAMMDAQQQNQMRVNQAYGVPYNAMM